jgi:parallel beta-helix repeat protein
MHRLAGIVALLIAGTAAAQPASRLEAAPRTVAPAGSMPATGVISEPTVITKPGSYKVVRPIKGPGTVIDIRASNVRLDLNGYTVESTTEAGATIRVKQGNTLEGVTIEGGSIRGGSACLLMDRTVRSSVRSLVVAGCAGGLLFDDNEALTVEDNRVGDLDRPTPVFFDSCHNCTIANNTITAGLGTGLEVGIANGGRITGNNVGSSVTCFRIGGNGARVAGNVAQSCVDAMKIDLKFGLIENNQLSSASTGLSFGIQSEQNLYRGNVVRNIYGEPFVDQGVANQSAGDNFLPDAR